MAPVLRNKTKSAPEAVPSTSNNNPDNRRELLPADLMTRLMNQRFWTLSLNVNRDKETKRPLTHGMKVLLPISKAAITNGMLPDYFKQKLNPTPVKDIRDDPSKKAYFLSCLNLVEKNVAETKEEPKTDQRLALEKKLRSRKGLVRTYFRNNPLPFSSSLGRKIFDAGLGKVENPNKAIAKYEKYCSSSNQNHREWKSPTRQLRINSREQISEEQYCHIYSFGARERRKRNFALNNFGLNEKSFSLYRNCKDASVQMSKEDILKAKAALKVSHGARKKGTIRICKS